MYYLSKINIRGPFTNFQQLKRSSDSQTETESDIDLLLRAIFHLVQLEEWIPYFQSKVSQSPLTRNPAINENLDKFYYTFRLNKDIIIVIYYAEMPEVASLCYVCIEHLKNEAKINVL